MTPSVSLPRSVALPFGGLTRIWCDSCEGLRNVVTDYLPSNEQNDHDAVDLICGACRLVIATLHAPAPIPESERRIPIDRTHDTVTPDEWRAASTQERAEFHARQARSGFVSFVCLTCGFPTPRGQATCEACR